MTRYGDTLPLFPEMHFIKEVRTVRSVFWDKKPGYWRDEARKLSKRLSVAGFLARYCRCSGESGVCKGHGKDWSAAR